MKLKLFGINFLFEEKDGGSKSKVWMTGFEWKKGFSILLLRFEKGTREAYHSHAFNCVSMVLWGWLVEYRLGLDFKSKIHGPETITNFRPRNGFFITTRDNFHKVHSVGRTWVLTFRGPWANTWDEINEEGKHVVLTHGRKEVGYDTITKSQRYSYLYGGETEFARKHGTHARQ